MLLKSNTGSGHGIPTVSHTVIIARYQPQTTPTKPNPPAMCSNLPICSMSASVVAWGIEKSAAAMKEKSMTRPKKSKVNKAFTRMVPIRKIQVTSTLLHG